MKIYKLLIMAVAVLGFTACSDDEDFNTASGVTVNMENATMNVRESRGLFKVPVVVTGDANGPIKVTVQVEEVGENPAMENVHYLVTQETINIPATEKSVGIEIKTVDNTEENDAREFKITIVSAEGATIGSDASTLVTIKDDDADPYVKLQGTWTLTYINYATNAEQSCTITMTAPEADDSYYGKFLYGEGFRGYYYFYLPFGYKGDEETGDYSLYISIGEMMSDYMFNFSSFYGVYFANAYLDGTYTESGKMEATVNDDFTEITFTPTDILVQAVYEIDTSTYAIGDLMGYVFRCYNLKMVKNQ